MTRRGLAAEHAIAPFDDVEVELEDAPLVEDRLEHHGNQCFLGLAPITSFRRKEEVLGELLADRRAPSHDAALAVVPVECELYPFPVEAFMVDEPGVLGGDHRALELHRDALVRNPGIGQARIGSPLPELGEPHGHECRFPRGVIAPPPDVGRVPCLQQDERGGDEQERPEQPAGDAEHEPSDRSR